ncbi:MAG: penicillin-binding protein 1C [Verrucomicrobiae bacterium]|nr:penicillin-binding protein 1C [Verrucomicrobiae bacterium]NNJ41892.1 penicillin-binding protein 1C [Akkermansiaceae bacterium]
MKLNLPGWLKKRPKNIRRNIAYACLATLGACLTGYFILPLAFPVPASIATGPAPSVMLLDRDGEPLNHRVRADYYRQRATSLDDIPSDLIQATLAAEDRRFYQHGGIDIRATARALRDSFNHQYFVSGASTVTQQTVKLSSHQSSRTILTKARECLTARHVEMVHTKDEILTSYFNHLDYGNLSQGPLQAARSYFGKALSQLSLAECALLAGLPQAPSRLNPRRNPEAAIKRRNWILDRMTIVYQTPKNRIERAKREPMQLHHQRPSNLAPHLAQLMRYSTTHQHEDIHTTLSASLQRDVTDIVRHQVNRLADKHIQNAGVVVIHNPTGQVLAFVGSPDFQHAHNGQIDAARTPRSPGSALKPFTYLLAFEQGGMNPATIIEDIPTRFADSRGEKAFVNYNRSHQGPVTIHHALANSLNIPAVRVLNTVGGASALHQTLNRFGITTLHQQPAHYGLGLTLGSGEVTLLELTNAYATLARMGRYQPVRFLPHPPTNKPPIASYASTWMLAQTMCNNAARTSAFGPHSSLRLPFPCAVKTGTSTDFRDNWCLGFTADFTVGVWAGNLDNTPMRGISGVTGAGPIFHATMLRLHRDHNPRWFKQPQGMTTCHIHTHTGKRLPNNTGRSVTLTLPTDQLPPPAQPSDYDLRGRVLLDTRYAEWLIQEADRAIFAQLNAQNSSSKNNHTPLRIIAPSREAKYMLDPDLPKNGKQLQLITDFPNEHTWNSPTLKIQSINGHSTATLTPGKHLITLTDTTGRHTTRLILVEEL